MLRTLFAAALLAVPAIVTAQNAPPPTDAAQGEAPQRIRSVLTAPGQACPPAQGNEIVVCAPLEDPYRIPKSLRRSEPTAANRSWASRSQVVDDINRSAGGVPGTCSATGTGGQTGCTRALLERWTEETRARNSGAAIP